MIHIFLLRMYVAEMRLDDIKLNVKQNYVPTARLRTITHVSYVVTECSIFFAASNVYNGFSESNNEFRSAILL